MQAAALLCKLASEPARGASMRLLLLAWAKGLLTSPSEEHMAWCDFTVRKAALQLIDAMASLTRPSRSCAAASSETSQPRTSVQPTRCLGARTDLASGNKPNSWHERGGGHFWGDLQTGRVGRTQAGGDTPPFFFWPYAELCPPSRRMGPTAIQGHALSGAKAGMSQSLPCRDVR